MANQYKTATFTGTEAHVDLAWDANYTAFVNLSGLNTTDGTIPGIRLTNPSNPALPPDNTGVRVEPTAMFSGSVVVLNIEVSS